MATADRWDELGDDEVFSRLTARGVGKAQAAWVVNNRDDPEAQAFIARVAGS